MEEKNQKFLNSIKTLENAMQHEKKALHDDFSYAAIAKLFEVSMEYAWKFFKNQALREGLDVYSPRDAIKIAGRLDLIDNVEVWLEFLNNRNLAVHDYLGITREEYLASIGKYLLEVKKVQAPDQ